MKFELICIGRGVYRAKVIGGWIVNIASSAGETSVFVPDPEHKWEITHDN